MVSFLQRVRQVDHKQQQLQFTEIAVVYLFTLLSGCGFAQLKERQIDNSSEVAVVDQGIVFTRSSPFTQLSNDATPIVRLTGVVGNDVARIFSDSNCQTSVGTATANSSSVFVTLSVVLTEGDHDLYFQIERSGQLIVNCSSQSVLYTVDITPPSVPTNLTITQPLNNLNYSLQPTFQVSNTQVGDSIRLYSSSDCTGDLITSAWAANQQTELVTNLYSFSQLISNSSLINGKVQVYARAIDAAGNLSACSTDFYEYTYLPWIGSSSMVGHYCQYRTTYQNDLQIVYSGDKVMIGNPDDRGAAPVNGESCPSSAQAGDQYGSVTYYQYDNTNSRTYLRGTIANGLFGYDLAAQGQQLLVSAPGVSHVYLYEGTNLLADLFSSNYDMTDRFGESIDFYGNTIVIGAPQEDANLQVITNGTTSSADNSLINSGAVFVYYRTGNSWNQQAYIKAWNATTNSEFGKEVKVYKNRIAVLTADSSCSVGVQNTSTPDSTLNNCTDRGAIHIFKRAVNLNWELETYIKPSDLTYNFLTGFAFDQDRIAVQRNDGKIDIYQLTTNWQRQAILTPSNHADISAIYAGFGKTLDFHQNKLAVLNQFDDLNLDVIQNSNTIVEDYSALKKDGGIYIFEYSNSEWTQVAHLKNSVDVWSDGVQQLQMTSMSYQDGLLYAIYNPTGTTGEDVSTISPKFTSFRSMTEARVISGLPFEKSNLNSLNISVDVAVGIIASTYGEKYRYKLGLKSNIDCSVEQDYSAVISRGTPINNSLASYNHGDEIRLCILGSYQIGKIYEQFLNAATVIEWTKDTSY